MSAGACGDLHHDFLAVYTRIVRCGATPPAPSGIAAWIATAARIAAATRVPTSARIPTPARIRAAASSRTRNAVAKRAALLLAAVIDGVDGQVGAFGRIEG